MQTQPTQNQPAPISVLYDSECPICRFGVKNLALEDTQETLEIIDARKTSTFKNDVIARGYNLDREIVIRSGDALYSGGDALHFLAMRADRSTWLRHKMFALFRSRNCSRLLYPFLRSGRLILLWLRSVPKIHEVHEGRKQSTLRTLLGNEWEKLHPAIQARFATDPAINEHVFYRGVMETVECSLAGKLFAHLTRFIANPLTPYEGKNVRMDVTLHRKTGLAGVYWRRTYYYEGRTPYTVTSVKRKDCKGRMTECVGAGFGMLLDVKAEGSSLHFRSTRYFWQMGKFQLPLPHLLTPGETHVVHEDLGDGNFRFTISMQHICLGTTFYQSGIFREV